MPPTPLGPDFNIDTYLNPFIPRPRLDLLLIPISWFLGWRRNPDTRPIGSVLVWLWAFVGAFIGILAVETAFRIEALRENGSPVVIASFGASAILHYNTITSPLSQPRNALLGQLLSSLVAVSTTKLLSLSPSLSFLAGPLAVALSSALMGLTNTIYPPAGATALLCATSPEIVKLGWRVVPFVGLGTAIMVGIGCLVNNIQRVYPLYWWTADPLPIRPSSSSKHDIEAPPPSTTDTFGKTNTSSSSSSTSSSSSSTTKTTCPLPSIEKTHISSTTTLTTTPAITITLTPHQITLSSVPPGTDFTLTPVQNALLSLLQDQLQTQSQQHQQQHPSEPNSDPAH